MNQKRKSIIKKVLGGTALLLVLGGMSWSHSVTKAELSSTQQQLIKLQEKYDNQLDKYKKLQAECDKELKFRDKVLEEKRDELDEKDREIERLQKIEIAHKVCPTREVSRAYSLPNNTTSSTKGTPIQMRLSFYGDFAHENGGYAGRDAQGNKLVGGTVASNVYPFGTTFVFEGRTFTVRDRGGSNFNSYNRLDVFVPRLQGESDAAYKARISHYGVRTVTMYKQ